MRVPVPAVIAALLAFATAVAQILAAYGRLKYDRWPLLRNPNRGLRLAYAGALTLMGMIALATALSG